MSFSSEGFRPTANAPVPKLFEQVFVAPDALLQNGRLPRCIGWERHIVEPFRLKGKGCHRRTQFVCRVGDKPLTVADVFIRTFQKQVDGGYEPSDFTGNIVPLKADRSLIRRCSRLCDNLRTGRIA